PGRAATARRAERTPAVEEKILRSCRSFGAFGTRQQRGITEVRSGQELELLPGFERVALRAQQRVHGVEILLLQFGVCGDRKRAEAVVLISLAGRVAELRRGIRGPFGH